jgi:hypothetical protein
LTEFLASQKMIAYEGKGMPLSDKENLRQIFGLAIVILFLLTLVALAKFSPKLVVVLIGLLFLYAGSVVAFRQAKSVRWFSKWGCIRRVRKIRRAFIAPLLHWFCTLFALLWQDWHASLSS